MGRHRSRAWGSNGTNGKSRGRAGRGLPTRRLRLEALEDRRLLTGAPAMPDLLDISDSGVSPTDNLTNLDNSSPDKALRFTVGNTVAGMMVTIYADGMAIGSAIATGATTIVATNGSYDLVDGVHAITSRLSDRSGLQSPDSPALNVTIDTFDPALNSARLGGYDTNGDAYGVTVSGTLAYVATYDAGLEIIDVTNPAAPIRLGGLDTTGHVAVSGTLAYAANGDAGLVIIEVSNPKAPVRLGRFDTSGRAIDVAVSGKLAYVADWSSGLQIIDVTNPAAPVRVGGCATTASARAVVVSGTLAYVANNYGGLEIIDVSNPANPVWLSRYTTASDARDVAVAGPLAYVADYWGGLEIIDVSNPAMPVQLGRYKTASYARDVAIAGSLAYVANERGGLEIIDVSDPAAPVRLGGYYTEYGLEVAVLGAVAYVATGNGGLAIIGTSRPGSPPAPTLQWTSDTGIRSFDRVTSDNTPTFDLAVSAGLYFRFYRDGVQISGDYESGASYTTPLQADGTYDYSVVALDAAGNASMPSRAVSVTVDKWIPSAPDLLAVSDTGVSSSDDLTNLDNSQPDKALQFVVGNTVAGATVNLYAEGTLIGSAVAQAGATTVTTNGSFDLADGQRVITARQALPGRPESTDSAALTVTVDTVFPLIPPAPHSTVPITHDSLTHDNLTHDNTPAFCVHIPYGSRARFYRDGLQVSADGGATYTDSAQGDGTYRYTVAAVDAAGNVSDQGPPLTMTIHTQPPRVKNVLVGGTGWTSGFLADLNAGSGDNAGGYSIPAGSGSQLATLPWSNIDQIKVVFTENVNVFERGPTLSGTVAQSGPADDGFNSGSVTCVHFEPPTCIYGPPTLWDVLFPIVDPVTFSYNPLTFNDDPLTSNYDRVPFNYDPITFTATWTLPSPLAAGAYQLRLGANGAWLVVSDLMGFGLDGEWANPATPADANSDTYPSGNGVAGGDFVFQFRVLPGDANHDGAVDILDVAQLQVNYGADHGMMPEQGDFNGDGRVDIFDVALLQVEFGRTLELPAPAPAPSAVDGEDALPLVASRPAHFPKEHLTRSVRSTESDLTRSMRSTGAHLRRSVRSTAAHLTRSVRRTGARGVPSLAGHLARSARGIVPSPEGLWESAVDRVLEHAEDVP